jgi:hypothetical protein
MRRLLVPGALAMGMALALAACTDPYDPGQRAAGGGLLGAGAGAAGHRRIGGRWSWRFGRRSNRWRGRCGGRGGNHSATTPSSLLSASSASSPLLSIAARVRLLSEGKRDNGDVGLLRIAIRQGANPRIAQPRRQRLER